MPLSIAQWDEVRAAYAADILSVAAIAAAHGTTERAINRRRRDENWPSRSDRGLGFRAQRGLGFGAKRAKTATNSEQETRLRNSVVSPARGRGIGANELDGKKRTTKRVSKAAKRKPVQSLVKKTSNRASSRDLAPEHIIVDLGPARRRDDEDNGEAVATYEAAKSSERVGAQSQTPAKRLTHANLLNRLNGMLQTEITKLDGKDQLDDPVRSERLKTIDHCFKLLERSHAMSLENANTKPDKSTERTGKQRADQASKLRREIADRLERLQEQRRAPPKSEPAAGAADRSDQ